MDLVKSTTSNDRQALLARLHKALNLSRQQVDPNHSDDTLQKLRDKDFSAFRAFTDNIVIGQPIRYDGEIELGSVFDSVSYFQMLMTMEGFFVRGAIAIGDLYMDDIAVFGAGLIEAYEAETTLARDPRIVLSPSAQVAVNRHLEYYGRGAHAPQNRDLLRDSDGQYFVNYLDTLIPEDGYFYEQELAAHKARIEEKLVLLRSRPSVWTKYLWAANYHNYWCDQNSCVDSSMKIDTENFQLMPARLVPDA
ncbi:hypothetical protein [Georgfuchsia toluolica]|nr:hypothetical protein [Georgfuchsia toluolica]